MAEGIPSPQLTAVDARAARDVLLEQERILRYERFGASEALRLGGVIAALAQDYGEGVSVIITRETDGVRMFQWVADDKSERNLLFAEGKRAAARKAGHASPWASLRLRLLATHRMCGTTLPPRFLPAEPFPFAWVTSGRPPSR